MSPSRPKKKPFRRPSRPSAHKKKGSARKKKPAAPRRNRKLREPAQHPSPTTRPENPRARALAQRLAALLLDKKASDVVLLDVRGLTSYADYFVVASGDSERQVSAMADHVEETLKAESSERPLGIEGRQTGHWVLLDYGEVVAHLFFSDVRAFYDIEGLWADAPREKVA